MTKDEALKLALDALEKSTKYFNIVRLGESRLKDTEIRGASHAAMKAIKEALAQPDAFEQGRQEGMKQERALWELSRLGQEIEAQPEQEPVATVVARQFDDGTHAGNTIDWAGRNCENDFPIGTQLYAAPPQRHPLTDEEIAEVAERMEATDATSSFWREFARAIEAKLKEKNT